MKEEILCIGDAMVDVIVELGEDINIGSDTQSKISMIGGGAAANTACWLGSQKEAVRFVGKVGSDAAGKQFISDLESFGVSHNDLCSNGANTGMVVVLVDKNGERTMFPDPGANRLLSEEDLPDLTMARAVLVSGYSLYKAEITDVIMEMMERTRAAGVPLIFDPASVGPMRSFGRERVLNALKNVDCVILNRDEARFLADCDDVNQAANFLHHFAETIVVKLGSDGALGIDKSGVMITSPSVAEEVVDTTGAGDAFAAGFLPTWLKNRDLKSALDSGNRLASKCVAILGARPRVITR